MKEIKHTIHESHSHCYDLDINAFSDFITDYPDLIMLKKQQGRWGTATGFDIATMLKEFTEQTLPAAEKKTLEDNNGGE